MTWYHETTDDGSGVKIWDHTATAGDDPITTVPLNNPRTRTNRQIILDVMYVEAVDAYEAAGGSVDGYALNALADAAFEQFEEGSP